MKRILYPRSGDKELDPALFKNPTNEYRAVPFWAWNCRLDPETLLEDVEQFRQMGMGGAHIHCRTGLDTPYLGEEFFQIVSACEKKMEAMGLRLWLYDEDRWPSTADPQPVVSLDSSFNVCTSYLIKEGDCEGVSPAVSLLTCL